MIFRPCFSLPFLLATFVVAEPLTPETATRFALENNPELAAARELIAEAEARASGLGRLPNPELETEVALGRQGRGRVEIGLSQTFPRASRLRVERNVAADSLDLARREVALAELVVVACTRLAVLELAVAQAELELGETQAALAREFAVAQVAQVRAGQLSALDAAQAELLAREAELAVIPVRAARAAAAANVATVLGREADDDLAVVMDLALPPEENAVPPSGLCGDLAVAEARVEAATAEIALARAEGREDYRLGVFVEGEQVRSDFGEREREAMLGFRFSMPLPVRSVAGPLVAEKQAARRRLTMEREARAREVRNAVAAGAAEVRARHAAARAIAAELLPAARAHVSATEAAHARGEVELAAVFRARERLSGIERSDLAARHAYHRAAVRRLSAACCFTP